MGRRSNSQDRDFSFAWSLIHEMGSVAVGAPAVPVQPAVASLWSMMPVNLTDRERMANACTILGILCELPVLEMELKNLLSMR